MKKNDYLYIEKQIERFFSGETTASDEKELYAFFSNNEIPEEWQKYRPVFAFFEENLTEELKSQNPDLLPLPQTASHKKRFFWYSIAAAVIALALISGIQFFNKPTVNGNEENFVMVNGEKITDPEIIEYGVNVALLQYVLEEIEFNSLLRNSNMECKNNQWDFIEVTIRE